MSIVQRARRVCEETGTSPLTFGRKVLSDSYSLDALESIAMRLGDRLRRVNEAMDAMMPPPAPFDVVQLGFMLDIPTSTNKLHSKSASGVYRSAEYRAWAKTAGTQIMAQRPAQMARSLPHGPYGIDVLVPTLDAGDIDNRVKALLDLLRHMGVTPDDKHLFDQRIRRSPTAPRGRCCVSVFSVDPSAGGDAIG